MILPSWCKIVRSDLSAHERQVLSTEPVICAEGVAELVGPRILAEEQEVMYVLALDPGRRVIAMQEIARGGRSSLTVASSEVFRLAIAMNAAAVILVHNHPSGNPWPTSEDTQMTMTIQKDGEILGLQLLDHVIIARKGRFGFYSYLDAGKFEAALAEARS